MYPFACDHPNFWTRIAVDSRRQRLYLTSFYLTSFEDIAAPSDILCVDNLPKEWFASPSLLVNWRRTAVLIAFLRANTTHPFQTSILPIIRSIVSLLPF